MYSRLLSVDVCEHEIIFSEVLSSLRFLFYLGQHDVFIEFVPFKIILNLKKYSEKNCLCPVWTHCKLRIDGNVMKPVTKEYFHIVIFVDHVKLAKLKMKAEM